MGKNSTADIIIIGGGVVGCSTAYNLAKRGAGKIRLLERGAIFCEETVAFVIDRPLANIDEPLDLAFAEFLENRESEG